VREDRPNALAARDFVVTPAASVNVVRMSE